MVLRQNPGRWGRVHDSTGGGRHDGRDCEERCGGQVQPLLPTRRLPAAEIVIIVSNHNRPKPGRVWSIEESWVKPPAREDEAGAKL